ncbi:transaldolase [Pelagicoccus sp. SDUM812003]|uniref:transaldolase n=1 Tax=Pelagicoccus sp. SDUM812003 TaxID=3041267 RepID=UPI00280EAD2C|nr:transaldolase [Pelagicoccus sp. SDUM812003]MDQ8205047.1 transaldolase [Pelagicoccus sp. SDUM812003]
MSAVAEKESKLRELRDYGQSYWLDNLTREMIETGELERRVNEEGLLGITSNPKTFADSVKSGDRYDQDIERLATSGKSDVEIYESLMIEDVRNGCDALMPVYEETRGGDGFVSIEVDPRLARQSEATLAAACSLWERVDRPNVMIKIPGTEEGLDAIEEALFRGINVNITLLFSNERYRRVVARYLWAMERRLKHGLPVDGIASVASFFLSRIDSLVDELLEQRALPACHDHEHMAKALKGHSAIAQACLAYRSFREAFSGRAWEAMEERGAQIQRPLWASTSVKSDDYPDTLYVDSLIARDTVNTMPEKTIDAFTDHGALEADSIRKPSEQADLIMEQLEAMGVDMAYVAQRLEDEGIQKFIQPFEDGLAAVSKQAKKARSKKKA